MKLLLPAEEGIRLVRRCRPRRVVHASRRLRNARGPEPRREPPIKHEGKLARQVFSIFAAQAWFDPSRPERFSIGRPIHGVRLYLLDAAKRQVPIGMPGEILDRTHLFEAAQGGDDLGHGRRDGPVRIVQHDLQTVRGGIECLRQRGLPDRRAAPRVVEAARQHRGR